MSTQYNQGERRKTKKTMTGSLKFIEEDMEKK